MTSKLKILGSTPPAIFHVTHWKAGSQWVSKILSELASERIVPTKLDSSLGQFLHETLLDGGIYPTVYVTREQFNSVALPESYRKFVVLRDLRDTLVSSYFSLRYSHPTDHAHMVRWRRLLSALTVEDGLMLLMGEWLPACAEIQRSWLESGERIIHYEDLLVNAFGILEDVLIRHCELEISSDRLKEVVALNQFESLTGGRKPGTEELSAHERKGISGDWRNHFTPVVHSKFNHLYGDLLVQYLRSGTGYSRTGATSTPASDSGALTLGSEEVLHSYDLVCSLHPHAPQLSHWRAWELAAYQKLALDGRVLHLGCEDGRYFRLIWPDVSDVIGVAADPAMADAALRSGVYRYIHAVNALAVPELSETFDHVFANGTLGCVDHLDDVLAEVQRCLKPGGSLICSVVTDRFLQWNLLPAVVGMAAFEEAAARLTKDSLEVHHFVNPLSIDEWQQRFSSAGLVTEVHIPILPKVNSSIFLMMDSLWHVKKVGGGEFGDMPDHLLSESPNFPNAFRSALTGLLQMETDWQDCSGAVFLVRKPLRTSQ
jgi:SAM-dependent methyltransferase